MEIFLYSPGLYINISVLKPEPKQYTVHTFSRPIVCRGTSSEGSLEGCSSGDDLDQLPGDDGSVKGVVHRHLLSCRHGLLRENRDVSGLIRDNGLVVVVQQMPRVELVATSHDRVGNLGSIIEGGRQTADLTAHHDQLLGEKSGHEGPRLVSHTEDLDVVQTLARGHLVVKSLPDVLTDTAVNCPGQSTVRGQSHIQLLGR